MNTFTLTLKIHRMRNRVFIIACLVVNNFLCQNDLRLYSSNGELFTIYIADKKVNENPQTEVLVHDLSNDTIKARIEWQDKNKYPVRFFLLDKGKPVQGKEFDYRLELSKNRIHSTFTGMYDLVKLPSPLVPQKPVMDTSYETNNKMLGHFCELKDGQAAYFNNRPKNTECSTAMPDVYLNYVALLMQKAEVHDDKYEIVEATVSNNCLKISQLNSLLTYIDYDLDKLKLIRTAYFNLTDKENHKQLESSLKFESSVRELNNFLNSSSDYRITTTANCQVASPNEALTAFSERLAVATNDTQRLETFKKLYGSYCYTTARAKALLEIFIHDREKLQAAKMLYFYVVDKEAYQAVSEAFSYKQTVSDLENFIEAQSR